MQIRSLGGFAMTSDKEKQLLASLDNKEYREALAIEHVNTTLAIQIRKMRENQNPQWSQSDLANRFGKHQTAISQWENPDYGRHSIKTLKELAGAFDVALLVKFIPFSELVKDMVSLSETRLSPPSFSEEQYHAQVPAWDTTNVTPVVTAAGDVRDLFLAGFTVPDVKDCASTASTVPTTEKEKAYVT